MSKLAHSDSESMNEISMRAVGFRKITEIPVRCDFKTPPRWYRPEGGRCPWKAHWISSDGRALCNIHAKKESAMTPAPDETQLSDEQIEHARRQLRAAWHGFGGDSAVDRLCDIALRHNTLRAQIDAAGGEVAEPRAYSYLDIGGLPHGTMLIAKVDYDILNTAYAALRVKLDEMKHLDDITMTGFHKMVDDCKTLAAMRDITLEDNAALKARADLAEQSECSAWAVRYKWLRDNTHVEAYWIDGAGGIDTKIRVQGSVDFLDKAIDAAIAAQEQK